MRIIPAALMAATAAALLALGAGTAVGAGEVAQDQTVVDVAESSGTTWAIAFQDNRDW
ncbi:hypothetical protein B0I31_103602 [Saccharothrix carnea]|uniref:Uncharacterized protein n=1 Tax=Saccharothrix carnea TaxID=1280637 RepID=A0A2P8IEG2_SACCR|nr:hypothetical protein [Saccharothrix carnea]PSL56843.1 hypothetical protein B0I31_103602 [Saccharothrix carnea]